MDLLEIFQDIVENGKSGKVKIHNYNGKIFQSYIYNDYKLPFIPKPHCKSRRYPTVIIWRLENDVKYAWFDLIYHELVDKFTHVEPFTGQEGKLVHKYLVNNINVFNVEQAETIISGIDNYYSLHDKFSDIYSEDRYIMLTYRDKFDDKRYRKVFENFEWYFYILKNDYDKMLEILVDMNRDRFILKVESEGTKWLRIYCHNMNTFEWTHKKDKRKDPSWMIKDAITGMIPTFEADLTPAHRYAIDNEIKIETDLKILYYDIETDDSTKQIDMEVNPILSIGGVDSDERVYWKCSSDEKSLLEWWRDLTRHYDIIVGWNSYNFDGEYIYQRGKMYKIFWKPRLRFCRFGHIDLMKRIIGTIGKFMYLRSYKLDDIAFKFIGERKITYDGRIIDLFNHNRGKLKEYNLQDCWLLKKIDEKMGISKLMIAMCEWTGSFPTMFRETKAMSGISVSQLLDMYILRHARGTDIHYPTAVWDDTDKSKFKGGLVLEPIPGIYKDVHILDFISIYPAIISSWKISPENIRYDCDTDETLIPSALKGIYFYKDRLSIFPHLVESLVSARKTYKKMMFDCEKDSDEYKKFDVMQQVAKELCNSMYGQAGQRGNRYYNHNVAGSITAAGRYLLRLVKEYCEELGLQVIYGDTDSAFVTGLEGITPKTLVELLNAKIDSHLSEKFGIDKSFIELEYEKKMSRFIQVGGKNYACLLSEQDGAVVDKELIRGLACVKRSTTNSAKREQEKVIKMLLREDNDKEFYINHVAKLRREWMTMTAPLEDIVIKTKISKHPKEYANTAPHVRVAEKLIAMKKEFYPQMIIPYVIINKKNHNEVHVDDYCGEYDKLAYWEKILKPLEAVLQVCFKDYEWGYHLHNTAPRKKKPKCPLCGYVKCRCQAEYEDVRAAIMQETVEDSKLKKKGRFIIKDTGFNKSFIKG